MPVDHGLLDWISSEGGPLILMPKGYLPFWQGVLIPENPSVIQAEFRWSPTNTQATDYDRACDTDTVVGLLEVGNGWGAVLSEGYMPTAWWTDSQDGGVLIQGGYGESERFILSELPMICNEMKRISNIKINIMHTPMYLFDAGLPGKSVEQSGEYLTIDLPPGSYSVISGLYESKYESLILSIIQSDLESDF